MNDKILIRFGKPLERADGIDAALAAMAHEIILAFSGLATMKCADDAIRDREGAVGNDALHIDADDASEARALGAGSQRGVKGKEAGGWRADIDVAVGTMPSRCVGLGCSRLRIDDSQSVIAEAERDFDSLGEAGLGGVCKIDAILNNQNALGKLADFGCLVGAVDFAFDPDAQIALLGKEIEKLLRRCVFRSLDAEGKKNRLVSAVGKNLPENGVGSSLNHLLRALWAKALGDTREEEFQVIIDFRDRADR